MEVVEKALFIYSCPCYDHERRYADDTSARHACRADDSSGSHARGRDRSERTGSSGHSGRRVTSKKESGSTGFFFYGKIGSAMPYPIIALVGPSGSGKTMLIDAVVEAFPARLQRIKSIVTRQPRDAADHLMYDFITPEEFNRLDAAGDVLERLEYAGNWYGIRKSHLDDVLSKGCGIAALVEEGVRYFQNLGYPMIVIRIRPTGPIRPYGKNRVAVDVEREKTPIRVDHVIENSFTPGGQEKAISDLLAYLHRL